MYGFSTLFALALPLATLAGPIPSAPSRQLDFDCEEEPSAPRKFDVVDMYQGKNFFDGFEFFTAPDPTHGNVNFQSADDAFRKGLAYVQDDNTTILAVDSTTHLPVGGNRDSTRIESKKSYTNGLFIADFFAMPHGCGVWPAWWTVGEDWPNNGEIDIIEGVNNQINNQMTLHTSQGCTLERQVAPKPHGNQKVNAAASGALATGKVLTQQCAFVDGNNDGCAFSDEDNRSHGKGFNLIAGGVFAHLWEDDSIKIWHFARGEIPQDIEDKNPNPDNWPTPQAVFTSASCNIKKHFKNHKLVLDTTICGDFAGSKYAGSGCPGTCAEAVADPKNFKFADWKINYIAVYDRKN